MSGGCVMTAGRGPTAGIGCSVNTPGQPRGSQRFRSRQTHGLGPGGKQATGISGIGVGPEVCDLAPFLPGRSSGGRPWEGSGRWGWAPRRPPACRTPAWSVPCSARAHRSGRSRPCSGSSATARSATRRSAGTGGRGQSGGDTHRGGVRCGVWLSRVEVWEWILR